MGKELLIRLLVSLLGEYLIKPSTAAPYKKYLLRARDYLNLLFPLDRYPEGDYSETNVANREAFAVPGGFPVTGGASVKTGAGKGGRMDTRAGAPGALTRARRAAAGAARKGRGRG